MWRLRLLADSVTAAVRSVRRFSQTPRGWRFGIGGGIVLLAACAYLLRTQIGLRGQSAIGVFFFFGLAALFSSDLRAVNWRTIRWGIVLQLILAVLVLKVGVVYRAFEWLGNGVKSFVGFSAQGGSFVFGNLADARPPGAGGTWSRLFEPSQYVFQFAFVALPPILFVSAVAAVLYHFGILQWCVQLLARLMVHLMRTSGAETLSVSANIFMGQTEAPLVVKDYVPEMTRSELFALMVSGFAHISGGMMAVYINYGADPVSVLTTCVMASPGSLYLAKLSMPEREVPKTSGTIWVKAAKSPYVNAIDAAASGTLTGLRLAANVAAMLIVFIAFVAMFDSLLATIKSDLSLSKVFGWLFSPAAFFMGVDANDVHKVGNLLGTKLTMNEHYAYLQMRAWKAIPNYMTDRSYKLTAFALTGFANFASVGIQLGGIGALAPSRSHELAQLGGRALFVGFLATLLNAAIAGVLLPA
jgi:concentrative nucleoside transporter, CNT family